MSEFASLQLMMRPDLRRRLSFFLLSALIGAVVGLSTLLLVQLVSVVQWVGYGDASHEEYSQILAGLPHWQVILVPAAGGLLLGVVMQFLPGKRYHGIADVMEACAMNSARMPARSGIGAALAAGISLGVGAPLGREGPAVHIGASISAWLAERLHLEHKQSLALLGCGAAAAVAASFHTPLAAVIFALEVVVGYYTLRVFVPVVIATIMAMLVSTYFLGNEGVFPVVSLTIESNWELLLFAILGLAGALLAKSVLVLTTALERLWQKLYLPRWLQPALAGVLMGLVATQLPLVMGLGLEGAVQALLGQLDSHLLLYLLIAKLFVVCLALSSGFAGGVFAPAIFLGSMLGGAFWALLSMTGLNLSDQGVYAAVGMAAAGSALLGAPISTVLIVFELTRDYGITLGVMCAAAFASNAMQAGKHGSFFRWQLARRHVDISRGRDMSLLITQRVEDLISDDYLRISEPVSVGELSSQMGLKRCAVAVFVDEADVFKGSASLSMLIRHSIENGSDKQALDAALGVEYTITDMTNIVTAVQRMAEQHYEFIPVLDKSDLEKPKLLGVVTKSDLLSEHYDVVRRAREDEFGVT